MKFIAENDRLTIKLQGVEMVWGLRRKIVMPTNQIVDLSWYGEYLYDGSLLRIIGAGLPGWLYSGNFKDINTGQWIYLSLEGRQGLALRRGGAGGQNVLVVTLQNNRYAKVIVNCRPDIGGELMKWWRAR